MPFPTTNIPLEKPDVRIFFEGLLILRPVVTKGRKTLCEVVVVNPDGHGSSTKHPSHEHQLTVEVLEEAKGKHPLPLVARLIGPLKEPLEITIDRPKGVKAFKSGSTGSLTTALDIKHLHSSSSLTPTKRPTIKLNEGQLRAAGMSGKNVSQVPYMSTNGTCVGMKPIATIMEARIRRNGRELTVKMGKETCSLEAKKKHVIYIRNSRKVSLSEPEVLTDFRHYYHEPDLKVTGQKWDIYWRGCDGVRDTTKIPCMSVVYDGL